MKRPRIERTPVSALNKDQVHLLLSSIDDEMYGRLVRVALATGMRRGELQGLSWANVDFRRRTISVNQSVIRNDGHEVISPNLKTASSRRTITIDEGTVGVLRRQKAYCDEMKLRNGWRASALVFPPERENRKASDAELCLQKVFYLLQAHRACEIHLSQSPPYPRHHARGRRCAFQDHPAPPWAFIFCSNHGHLFPRHP